MSGLKLSLIFLVVLLFDGLVLPAFFGLRESFLSLLILILPVLYMGPVKQSISYGLFFSVVLESLKGLDLGDLAIPFLFLVIIIYLTQKFLDIKHTYETRFGLGKSALVVLASVIFFYAFSFFYKYGGVNIGYFDPVVGLTIVLEALALVLIFNVIFNKKNDYS